MGTARRNRKLILGGGEGVRGQILMIFVDFWWLFHEFWVIFELFRGFCWFFNEFFAFFAHSDALFDIFDIFDDL